MINHELSSRYKHIIHQFDHQTTSEISSTNIVTLSNHSILCLRVSSQEDKIYPSAIIKFPCRYFRIPAYKKAHNTSIHSLRSSPKPTDNINHATTRAFRIHQPNDVPFVVYSPKPSSLSRPLASPRATSRALAMVLNGGTSVEISNHHHLPVFFNQCIYAGFQKFMIIPLKFSSIETHSYSRQIHLKLSSLTNDEKPAFMTKLQYLLVDL